MTDTESTIDMMLLPYPETVKKNRKKPGPKPRPLEQKYSARMTIWMTPGEYRLLEQEARKQGITTSVLLMLPFRHKDKE